MLFKNRCFFTFTNQYKGSPVAGEEHFSVRNLLESCWGYSDTLW